MRSPLREEPACGGDVARAAADRLPGAFVAPALPYGSSGEHQGFAGTLSIGAEATELVLVELGRSASETFDRLLFVNAHGGNAAPLAVAVARLREEGREARSWSPRLGGDAHAGRTETSLMLALVAGSGRSLFRYGEQGTTGAAEVGNDAPLAELIGRLRGEGVRAVSPNGVLGDPRGASAEEGRALLAAAVDDLCATLASWPREVGAAG